MKVNDAPKGSGSAMKTVTDDYAKPVQIMIVGAGPVGLATAIELAQRGVHCRVIDQTDDVGFNPRAKITNVRSMELMRRWGIAEKVREAAPLRSNYPSNIVFATSLRGYPLARIANAFYCDRERDERYAEPAQWIPQYTLVRVLRDYLRTFPNIELIYGWRLENIAEKSDRVTVYAKEIASGRLIATDCVFLVGADGAHSTVRSHLGISMKGQHAYLRNYTVVFRERDLAKRHSLGEAILYWLVNPACPGIMGPMDKGDLWFFGTGVPENLDVTTLDPVELIRRATEVNFDPEILAIDPWLTHRLVADRYRSDRIFLAGDACHLHPPSGGYGMNMGFGDALDLGWKLAAVLQGWGGTALLDAYQTERQPVHVRIIDEAVENFSFLPNQMVREKITQFGSEGDNVRAAVGQQILQNKVREFKNLGLVLGCRYEGSPIIISDGSAPPPEDRENYYPSAYPGCLAPHCWLLDGSSLYDHFGPGYTLITTKQGIDAASCLAVAAEGRDVPFHIFRHQDSRITDLYQSHFALIRPDQFVAWRGNVIPDAGRLLDFVRGAA
jgi:2-polyprenyl-6-methoxyphenol hydroxylase-like FAD-dependent oxidoreductase